MNAPLRLAAAALACGVFWRPGPAWAEAVVAASLPDIRVFTSAGNAAGTIPKDALIGRPAHPPANALGLIAVDTTDRGRVWVRTTAVTLSGASAAAPPCTPTQASPTTTYGSNGLGGCADARTSRR